MKAFKSSLLTIFAFLLIFSVRVSSQEGDEHKLVKLANLNFQTAPFSDVWVSNGRAFIGGYSDGKVHIVDVRDRDNIHLLGVYEPSIDAGILDLQARGDLLFCALSREGFTIVDVSDPAAPKEIAFYRRNLPRGVHDLFVTDNYVYVCDNGQSLLQIVDISDIRKPQFAGSLRSQGYTHDLTIVGNIGYIANIRGGFRIVDLTNPARPVVMADHNYEGSFTHNIWPSADGRFVFTTDETCGTGHLRAFDISDLSNIRQVGEYRAGGGDSVIHNVMVVGQYAYISYYKRGLRIADISDPANIREVAHFDTWDGRQVFNDCFEGAWGVYAEENGRVYISDISTGLWVFDFLPARANAASVRFLFPRGGEVFSRAQEVDVEWSVANLSPVEQRLELSLDGGATYQALPQQLSASARNQRLVLPNLLAEAARLRLTVNDGRNAPVTVESETFRIVPDAPPQVKLIAPRGGEQFLTTSEIKVEWSASDDFAIREQRIEISADGGQTFKLLARLDGSPRVFVALPTVVSTNCRIRIVAEDGVNAPSASTSEGSFAVFDKIPVIRAAELNDGKLVIDLDPNGLLLTDGAKILPMHDGSHEAGSIVEIDTGSGFIGYNKPARISKDGQRVIARGKLSNGKTTSAAILPSARVTIRVTAANGARGQVTAVRSGNNLVIN